MENIFLTILQIIGGISLISFVVMIFIFLFNSRKTNIPPIQHNSGYQPIKHEACRECTAFNPYLLGEKRYDETRCKDCKYNPTRQKLPTTGSNIYSPLSKAINKLDIEDLGPSIAGNLMTDSYKKKLDYIKDMLEDFSRVGKGNLSSIPAHQDLLEKIYCVVTNRTCSTCKYHQLEDITKGKVCVNADSEECTNWTDDNHTCTEYIVDPEWKKKYGGDDNDSI